MHCLVFMGALYFLPAIIAAVRHTHNSVGILLLNVFLGWTVVGWFVALVMAICSAPRWAYYYPYRW
ncbi:MAG: superinfection immunity protein [Terracidiphilus sp.]